MRPDFLKTGIIIRGIVLGILFLPNLLWADTDIGEAIVKQLNPAFTMGSSRSHTNPTPIPWSELGAQVSMQSQGRGTSIGASESGACLESMFQRLAGEVGEHGLQLWSTVKDDPQTRFSVLATGLGRRKGNIAALERSGRVEVEKNLIRFVRSGLVEEYTVSVDGVRQDLVIAEPPPGNGDLRVELSVAGATARPSDRGATLILQDSRRQLSYHRLRVLDARNRQLPARLVVESPRTLAVVVADANAVYPIRIDPTFSDADWHGMDFTPGAGQIHAVAVTSLGKVYVGGSFTAPGNHIAQWDGTNWSGVGSGADNTVIGLLVDGFDLYVCGWFTNVGASPVISANHIAKWEWDGLSYSWTGLGSGVEADENALVNTMAMDVDGNLYAGGNFTTAGGVSANNVAKWDGSNWTALGSGLGDIVDSLVMDGSGNLYAGGYFTTAGGAPAIRVAKWNGSNWSALGDGVNSIVKTLAVDANDNLYAGGYFTTAGGVTANRVAKWNGSSWSALGAGVNSASGQGVYALAIGDQGNLYVGGEFTAAGGVPASNIARWDGSNWIALGSGTDGLVNAITPSGDRLYVGGMFAQAGVTNATNVAYADNLPIAPGTYYVSIEGGNDSNDGSSINRWKTLHHAIDQINGGSAGSYTLNVAQGESSRYSVGDGEPDAELIISQDNVTVTGDAGTVPHIDGAGATVWLNGLEITGSNVNISSLQITNFSKGIKIDGSSPVINRNRIYENTYNVDITAGNGQTASPIIKNNEIYEGTTGSVDYGIYVGGNSGSTVAPEIYHNTIDRGTYQGILIEGTSDAPIIKYNIISNFRQSGIQNSGNPTIDFNDVWHNGPDPYTTNYVGCSPGTHDISQDPQYAGSYAPGPTSPCVNAIPTGNPPNDPVTVDLDDKSRPYGPGFDMGCYESHAMPEVTTSTPSNFTTTTASSGGYVGSFGQGAEVLLAQGVCWSTSPDPTTGPDCTQDGTSGGSFTSSITGLTPNTTYHVRAYATNDSDVTGYGGDKTFTTAAAVPEGTYYVNISSGGDSNDGSSAHPWKTLHYAISQINGGSAGTYVLYVALGTYSVNVVNGEADSQMVLSQSNVTIMGERGSAPIIDGTDAQTWTKGLEITGSNVTIENLYVTGFSDTNEEGIRVSGGTGNEIRYCKLYGNNWGIRVNEAAQTTIRNCEIYENSTHGIDDVLSTDTSVVENKLHGNLLYAIRTQSSSLISRNLIYDNTFGILVELINGSTASPTIKNNVIFEVVSGKMSYGIYIRAQNVSNLNPLIYHNTLDGGVLDGISMEEDGTGSSAPVIKYNIITEFGQYGIQNSGANPTIDYNDVWNNTAGNYEGCTTGTNDLDPPENPLYVTGGYSLQADSPCKYIIPSTEGDPVTLDYPGFKRPRPGEDASMGAYEYVADVTVNYTMPGGTGAATDYRIFTVPLYLGTGTDMLTAMVNVLGAYDPFHWRAFLYDGTIYNEFNSTQFASHTIKPGMGFWIITTYTDQIPFTGQPAPDGVDYVMDLDPGWHLIGLPWTNTSVLLSTIKVTDGVRTYPILGQPDDYQMTQKILWDYTGEDTPYNGYVRRTTAGFHLQNNEGYFFEVLSSTSIRLIIPHPLNASLAQETPIEISTNQPSTYEDDEAPPPPPGAEPSPDIKANGQDGPVTVNAGDSVSVSVSLDPGAWNGRNADWWIAAHTPFASPWYTYVHREGWKSGIQLGVQMPLFELLGPLSVLKMILPAGSYTFYFAVDGNMDGKPDVTWMDSVQVTVE